MIDQLIPLFVEYKWPTITFIITVFFLVVKYLSRKPIKKVTEEPDTPSEIEEFDVQQGSLNADMQDILMRKKTRLNAGWRARSFNRSELVPPKSRRWD